MVLLKIYDDNTAAVQKEAFVECLSDWTAASIKTIDMSNGASGKKATAKHCNESPFNVASFVRHLKCDCVRVD